MASSSAASRGFDSEKCLQRLGEIFNMPPDQKSIHAEQKPQLQLLPPIFLTATARCMELGAKKYGKWNWRENKVECQTYIGAMLRHITQYQSGEDVDPDSGQSHLAHVAASVAILLDAEKHGTLIDNRPSPSK